jgi:hypothetical protein
MTPKYFGVFFDKKAKYFYSTNPLYENSNEFKDVSSCKSLEL